MKASSDDQLQVQIALAEDLWAQLERSGVRRGALARVETIFFCADERAANSLFGEFAEDGWEARVADRDDGGQGVILKIVTRPLVMGREVLVELAKTMVQAGQELGCPFDGMQVAH
jgi:hypothetical protein